MKISEKQLKSIIKNIITESSDYTPTPEQQQYRHNQNLEEKIELLRTQNNRLEEQLDRYNHYNRKLSNQLETLENYLRRLMSRM